VVEGTAAVPILLPCSIEAKAGASKSFMLMLMALLSKDTR
jgi:hypothetical protein